MSGRQFFSDSEKACLQELIFKYKLHLLTTCGGPGNPAAKKIAWVRLTEEYNSIETNTKRTESQLRKCWDNIKTRRKQALAQEKKERMKTGGGFYGPGPSNAPEDMVLESLATELDYAIDSDTLIPEDSLLTSSQEGQPARASVCTTSTMQSQPSNTSHQNITDFDIVADIEVVNTPVFPTSQLSQPVRTSRLSTEQATQRPVDHDYGQTISVQTAGPNRLNADHEAMTQRSGSRLSDQAAAASQIPATSRNVRARVIADEFALRQEKYELAKNREDEIHRLKIEQHKLLIKAAEEQYLKSKVERESAEELLKCNQAKREEAELRLNLLKRDL